MPVVPAEWLNIGVVLISAALSGAFAAGGAWLAVRTQLQWLRKDVDDNTGEIGEVERRRRDDVNVLHERINRLSERQTQAGFR